MIWWHGNGHKLRLAGHHETILVPGEHGSLHDWFPMISFLKLGSFLNSYIILLCHDCWRLSRPPKKTHIQKIVLTPPTTLVDVCGGIFQTQGEGEIALRVWMDGDGQFGRSFEASSSLAETCFKNAFETSSECCGEPWLFRKKGNTAIHHPSEMSMVLVIHAKLPYAVMRKIATYHQHSSTVWQQVLHMFHVCVIPYIHGRT